MLEVGSLVSRSECDFPFSIPKVARRSAYEIAVGRRPAVAVTRAQVTSRAVIVLTP